MSAKGEGPRGIERRREALDSRLRGNDVFLRLRGNGVFTVAT
jgi:hypothetical protein